jgi:plasmid stabilization system protein ParE
MPAIRWLDDARSEALVVAQEYLEMDADLGVDLWDRIEQKLAFALRFPHTGKHVREVAELELRQHFLDRFKYTLVLAVLPHELVVVAFHHQRQDAKYWKPRLTNIAP